MSTDHLQSLRTFVAIADAGSLAGGARVRGLSAPAVTRTLAALEGRLGTRLILRTTRSMKLTEAGEQFLADMRTVLALLEVAEASVSGQRVRVQGQLAVTAPELFGERYIAPLMFEFLDRHPLLQARAFFTNRVVHLLDEAFDVALRIAQLPDSSLTAIPVGQLRVVLVASPEYIERHGAPNTPNELAAHRAVDLTVEGQGLGPWAFKRQRTAGMPTQRLLVNSNAVKVAAAVAGQGIARALAYQVITEVGDGRLQLLLAAHEPPPVPVHLVYPAGRGATAKVRRFVQFAAERLQALPVLQGKGLEPTRRVRPSAGR
jgi:DNA-binding transcriptional LysR family regulator